jgi:hypothetical protein
MLGLGIERPRKKHNGRRPLMDPRLDPNIDPKKAQRILANRQSAARTKLRQQMIIESAKVCGRACAAVLLLACCACAMPVIQQRTILHALTRNLVLCLA